MPYTIEQGLFIRILKVRADVRTKVPTSYIRSKFIFNLFDSDTYLG